VQGGKALLRHPAASSEPDLARGPACEDSPLGAAFAFFARNKQHFMQWHE
jgi:hypothetical protein